MFETLMPYTLLYDLWIVNVDIYFNVLFTLILLEIDFILPVLFLNTFYCIFLFFILRYLYIMI